MTDLRDTSRDERLLAAHGYRQELERGLSLWSSFSVGFATISPVVGIYSVMSLGAMSMGPSWVWVVPLCLLLQFGVALVYAELSSQFPLAGGCYQWVRRLVGDRLAAAHFHDTRGMGLANCYAAWQAGITRFDACLGGIGGCPHAPGASGNVTTEDLAFMLERMGLSTGLDVAALLALRQRVQGWLAGETLHGTLWQAGLPRHTGASVYTLAQPA